MTGRFESIFCHRWNFARTHCGTVEIPTLRSSHSRYRWTMKMRMEAAIDQLRTRQVIRVVSVISCVCFWKFPNTSSIWNGTPESCLLSAVWTLMIAMIEWETEMGDWLIFAIIYSMIIILTTRLQTTFSLILNPTGKMLAVQINIHNY